MARKYAAIKVSVYDQNGLPVGNVPITLDKARGFSETKIREGKLIPAKFDKIDPKSGDEYTINCGALPAGYQSIKNHTSKKVVIGGSEDYEVTFYVVNIRADPSLAKSADALDEIRGSVSNIESKIGTVAQVTMDSEKHMGNIDESLENVVKFIPADGGGLNPGSVADGASAKRRVDAAITAVTGRPLGREPATFGAVLQGTFPKDEQTGEIVRYPARALLSVGTGHGQLSAYQGRLFREVELIGNDALKLLAGLESISPHTDKEKAEALMEIVKSEFKTLIEEAGRLDGPRKQRVDRILVELKDRRTNHLRVLRQELGLDSGDSIGNSSLVLPYEAQLIGNMELLITYAGRIKSAFNSYFGQPAPKSEQQSFSGRLAETSLLFSVVAQSVREVELAMDAVGLSQPERRVAEIVDENGVPVSVEDILSWLRDFSTVEGPDLIAKSGNIGLRSVLATVKHGLEPLVYELLEVSHRRGNTTPAPHAGLTHSRVRYALKQLHNQITQFDLGYFGYRTKGRIPALATQAAPSTSTPASGGQVGTPQTQGTPGP